MPAATPNAADLAIAEGNQYVGGLIQGFIHEIPIIQSLPAFDMVGTFFLTLAIPAAATAGGFLHLNEGYISSKVQLVMEKVEAKRTGAMIEAAKSTTDLWNSINTGLNWLDIQTGERLKAEWKNMEKTIVTGTVNDAKGFLGWKQLTPAVTANVYALTDNPALPKTKNAINVAGTTSNTASSVYAVRRGPLDVALYMGGPGGVAGFLNMSPVETIVQADPGDSTRKQKYYYTEGEGYVGMAVAGSSSANASRKFTQFCLRRAFNLTAETGKGCTESLMDKLIATFPNGNKPDAFYMSVRSQLQLLADRIANGTVQLQPSNKGTQTVRAELPTEHRGIPIFVCEEAITDDQAIETVV